MNIPKNKNGHISRFRILFKIFAVCIALCMTFSFAALADASIDVTDNNLTYWEGRGVKKAVKTKAMFETVDVIDASSFEKLGFKNLEQAFAFDDKLYLLDGEAGIISVLDSNYNIIESISSFDNNGTPVTFEGSQGIFVDESGIYIAHTSKERIICTDGRNFKSFLTRPNSTAVPETLKFAPTRLVRDENDFLYVLCDGSYFGLMVFSDTREFLGFFGANKVQTSVVDAIKDFVTSVFETEEKHSASVQALPFQMIDVCIDTEGFICTVNSDNEGQLRRFGPAGGNTLIHSENFDFTNADNYNFGDYPNIYQDTSSKYGGYVKESFCSIACDSNGFYYIVDQTKGRIFVYDNKCNLLSSFGGGVGAGDKPGTFVTPSSVTVLGKDLIVTDYANKSLTIFRMTEYGSILKDAVILTNKSQYKEAKPYWEQINRIDKNCQFAYKGLAKAALQEKDYDKALEYSRAGWDRVTYSKAFLNIRNEFIKDNFIWISAIVVVAIGVIVYLIIISKKKQLRFIKNKKLRVALTTIIHPFESFKAIKYNGMGSFGLATAFLVVFYLIKVTSTLSGGFMYGTVDANAFNAIFKLIGSAGIVILWVICNQGVCTLFEGKGNVRDIYCGTCYSLTPMIIYYGAYLILSHTIVPDANSAIGILSTVCTGLTLIFILISVTVIHEFSFFKAMGTAILTIVGMLIVAFAIFLMITLLQDLAAFVIGIINEVTLR